MVFGKWQFTGLSVHTGDDAWGCCHLFEGGDVSRSPGFFEKAGLLLHLGATLRDAASPAPEILDRDGERSVSYPLQQKERYSWSIPI